MMMLQAHSLSYQVKGRTIVRDVDFSVSEGEFLAIIGANGAGKTSLLRLIAGDLKPSDGEILFKGKAVKNYKLKELALHRALLHQSNAMSMPFTVEEIVRMGRYHLSTSVEQHEVAVAETMKICAVDHLADRKIQQLSGGEQQRVHLARVLAQVWDQKNVLLLLDEPISSMDMQFQHKTLAIAKALTKVGFTVVAILHELNLVAQYADRVLMMKSGRKWWDGAPMEVLTPQNIFTIFGVHSQVSIIPETLTPRIDPLTVEFTATAFNSNYKHYQHMELKLKYEAYKKENPKARIYDCAKALGVSEMQLLLTQLSDDVVLLQPEMLSILQEINQLGYVMALTRNESCVHERKGVYPVPTATDHVLLFNDEDIDLRIFLRQWQYAFAVRMGTLYGLQFFDQNGTAVHKIYLTEESDHKAYHRLVARFKAADQRYFTLESEKEYVDVHIPDTEVDVAGFQKDWLAMKDSHEFFGILRKYNLKRTQALRLAPEGRAKQIKVESLAERIESASTLQVPLMVFVANKGCIQIHTGHVDKVARMANWFNVLDPKFNLHLNTDQIREVWIVSKPSTDGDVHALEAYDSRGELIVQIFGKRKPGVEELQSWRDLVAVREGSTY
ncbi:heme ABC transporter ATP-binding protein [Sphingobacterium spiritivorum]|nr:heme ABC transporter ATP-binding protein [Sphingobacterium spiritivorum]